MIRTRRTRRGVTLVELMVAAAMSIMGMWLLTWLYQQGLDSFRLARAQADLTGQERMVTTVITRDLKADHFMEQDGKPNRGRRLSDQRTDLVYSGGYTPPRAGYFWAGSFPKNNGNNIDEGSDSDGFSTTRSTDHFLQFTAILPGGPDHLMFSSEIFSNPHKQYFGTAAEISYYLVYTGRTAGGVPLHDLVRMQRLCARSDDDKPAYQQAVTAANSVSPPDNIAEVMVVTNNQVRTLSDLTIPVGFTSDPPTAILSPRLSEVLLPLYPPPNPPYPPIRTGFQQNSLRYGEDKLMSNVLSFEVKFTGTSTSINWPTPFTTNSDYPYDVLPFDGRFDTNSSRVTGWQKDFATNGRPNGTMKPIRITGAMIRIRAHDTRTRSTRQTTIIVDL